MDTGKIQDPNQQYWYAVYTRPRAEKQVFERLLDKGIDAFLPLQKRMKQWSDRKKLVETPLFSSYVFVNVNRSLYDEVLRTHGVVKYISFEGKAATIPSSQIDNLRIIIDSDADVETTWEKRKKGEKVRVNGGPLHGLEGILITDGKKNKVMVQVDRLDQNLVIEVPLAFVEPI